MFRDAARCHCSNAERVAEVIRALMQEHHPRALLLDLSAVFDFEYTALKMLVEAERRMREQGKVLLIAAPNDAVLNVLERSPLGQQIGRKNMFYNVETAVAHHETPPLSPVVNP